MVVQFSILDLWWQNQSESFGGGGEYLAKLGGALVRKVPTVDCEFEEIIF
jgi:hypothetical protein